MKNQNLKMKRSEIDETRFITKEVYAASLVRLPDKENPQHAFLVIEGKKSNKSMIWFADFVPSTGDLLAAGIRDGKVRMYNHESKGAVGRNNKLLFQCDKKFTDIQYGDRLLYSTWSITKSTAKKLINNIKMKQGMPPKYNILGNSALAASSASTRTCHNCFTFARTMLLNLGDRYIKIPEVILDKWVLSATSCFLLELNEIEQNRYQSWTAQLIWLAVAVACAAILFLILK